ncbi:hypothetical protein FQN60_018323 [Etheostoma spectabile]|uniref:Uncharacterized protein n=1 Tax=Etheostoma spectabile TaxID=54343 RepID=A0A5J5DHV8_9PERO|nr:hypothetical protein FQN60_018323 [Etheostoma spectabile]
MFLSCGFPSADSQQTEHLSSYQMTVPRLIGGRLRRDVDGRPPNQETNSAEKQLTSQVHFLFV